MFLLIYTEIVLGQLIWICFTNLQNSPEFRGSSPSRTFSSCLFWKIPPAFSPLPSALLFHRLHRRCDLSVSFWCFLMNQTVRQCQCDCNRAHLQIVFVLLYVLWVCRSVGVLSYVFVIRSFTYALRVVIYTSL